MSEVQEYTLTVFSENKVGVLGRVVGIVTRRHYNIESITSSASSMDGIHRITIVVRVTSEQIRKLCAQIDKQVDILKAFYYENHEIVYEEIALYKVATSAFFGGNALEKLMRTFNARVLTVEKEYVVVEKVGHEESIFALLETFKAAGVVYEFVRSGRVAIVKPMERLNTYLKQIES